MSCHHEGSPVAPTPGRLRRATSPRERRVALVSLAFCAAACGGADPSDFAQRESAGLSQSGARTGGGTGVVSLRLSSGTATAGDAVTGAVTLARPARS